MENKYLIDTNILVYYSNQIFDDANSEIDEIFNNSFNISIISKIEFLGWAGFHGEPGQYERAREFVNSSFIIYLDDIIAEETIKIRQKFKIKTPDAVIAATAIVNNLKLVTNNVDDFKRFNIEVLNPFD